jgi:hypothetical protein
MRIAQRWTRSIISDNSPIMDITVRWHSGQWSLDGRQWSHQTSYESIMLTNEYMSTMCNMNRTRFERLLAIYCSVGSIRGHIDGIWDAQCLWKYSREIQLVQWMYVARHRSASSFSSDVEMVSIQNWFVHVHFATMKSQENRQCLCRMVPCWMPRPNRYHCLTIKRQIQRYQRSTNYIDRHELPFEWYCSLITIDQTRDNVSS